MKIKKGDTVIVISGGQKGRTGKVIETNPKLNMVTVDGINVSKRHYKPSKKHAQGGIFEVTRPISVSKVGLLHPSDKKRSSRVGYVVNKNGDKMRVYRQAGNKEIK